MPWNYTDGFILLYSKWRYYSELYFEVSKLVKKNILEETLENCIERTMEWSRLFIVGSVGVCVHIENCLFSLASWKHFLHTSAEEKKQTKTLVEKFPLALLTFASVHLLSLTLVLISYKFYIRLWSTVYSVQTTK